MTMVTVLRQGSALGDGRYVLERRLGAGGMATVWLATDERLKRPVAIKLPSEALLADQTFSRRFEREAQTAAGLSHPNLVPVFDYGCEGERPYLVSEYISGETLARARERGTAPPGPVIAEAMLVALAQVHDSGIVHRDVKPGNVLVESRDRVLLTDFGIAQSTEETRLTQTGNVIGTADYLAPELKRGERATAASDLYACGVMLREGLTDNDPQALHDLVERLTAPDPRDRPASAADALIQLEGAAAATAVLEAETFEEPETDPQPTPARPIAAAAPPPARDPASVLSGTSAAPPREPPRPPAPPPQRSGSWRPAALVLAAVALIAVAVIALASGDGGDRGDSNANGSGKQAAAAAKEEKEPEVETSVSTTTETEAAEEPAPAEEPETEPVSEEGGSIEEAIALNDEGYALLQGGDPEGALPLLEQSVAMWPDDSTDPDHAYALFNYAQALRMTGNPEAAIPLLEQRLSFSDDRAEIVEEELALAQEEAGEG